MPTIQAHEHPIREIFDDNFAFSIPPYQRPYSWGTDQATELFSDLVAAAEDFNPTETRKKLEVTPYFLGSIVLVKTENDPRAEVIDGQQRLTTLALLLSTLRVSFSSSKQQEKFSRLLLEEGDHLIGTQDRCRLTLRERDHSFFETNILRHKDLVHLDKLLEGALTDPQRRLVENARLLKSKVADLGEKATEALAAFLLQHTYLVTVCTPDLDSAFRIFSVLNDRGLDLTAADILKAEIIGGIPDSKKDSFVKQWEDAEEKLGTARFAELFSHLRMIHARSKAKKSILQEVKESIPLLAKTKPQPERFIQEELIPASEAYGIILSKDFDCKDQKVAAEINRALCHLSRIGDTDWVPPAIFFITRNEKDPKKIETFLKSLERLAVSMWLRRSDINARIERYGKLLGEIEKGANLSAVKSALQLTKGECEETKAVLEGDIYNLTPKPKRTMLLLRLDELLSSGEASYEFDTITVEHILPQTPPSNSEWVSWWQDEEERNQKVHRIGNLALLNRRQNSAAKNWPFERKKSQYFQGRSGACPFAITTEVIRKKTWNPKDFQERQERFVNLLAQEWTLTP